MQSRAFAGIVLVSLLTVGGGVAQSPSRSEKPVWSMEFIKVKPGMFGLALGHLDDDWMRVREEAKHQGAVLSYHRVGEQDRILPSGLDEGQSDGTIVLLTEYKNQATYERSEKLFESIREHLPENASIVLRPRMGVTMKDLYDSVSTRVFQDYSDMDNVRVRVLAAN